MTPISEVLNIDCMIYMKDVPDKWFDLAIVDPPYGIGEDGSRNKSRGSRRAKAKDYHPFYGGDKESPSKEYFSELMRISKNQIIWGANHFISKIPYDSSCWIVWDKRNGENDFADCELAWTSFKTAVRKFSFLWSGMFQENTRNKEERIHPTQKPVALYHYLLKNYAKPGNRIFDSHLGSGSSRIAAYKMGFDFYATEIDPFYFNAQENRFRRDCFGEIKINGQLITQKTLFEWS